MCEINKSIILILHIFVYVSKRKTDKNKNLMCIIAKFERTNKFNGNFRFLIQCLNISTK